MSKKFFLPLLLCLLAFALWYSPSFNEITAGVAILLLGMMSLESGFKTFSEGPLKKLLKRSTNTLFKSIGLGFLSTAILQSSSLITVITISFISAGLLDLVAGIGIVFGANIGTTATAWVVAVFGLKVKISILAMPMLVFGVILLFEKKLSYMAFGNSLTGLGLFFLGIFFMKQGFDSSTNGFAFGEYSYTGFFGLMLFVGIGIAATVILQSSSATMAIILTALAAGQVTYPNALALAIGTNVGTTITAIIGATASNAAGKRVAGAHLIFNIVTALLALVFINQLSWVVDHATSAMGIAQIDYTLKLAIFHTIFNVLGVVVMIPFVNRLSKFLTKYIKEEVQADIDKPRYLTEAALMYPQSAISALVKETNHLFDNVFEVISHAMKLRRTDILSGQKVRKVIKQPGYSKQINIDELYLHKIKTIYSKIIQFATISQQPGLSSEKVRLIYNIKEANRYFVEVIKELKDLQPNMAKFLQSKNPIIRKEYDNFRKRIVKIVRSVLNVKDLDIPQDLPEDDLQIVLNSHIEFHRHKLEKQRALIKEHDLLFNGTLDALIRDKEISSADASSLMNDSATVARISKNLIKSAELLYLETDMLMMDGAEIPLDPPE